VTTQNTHSEHGDVDATAVEQQHVPETTVEPTTTTAASTETSAVSSLSESLDMPVNTSNAVNAEEHPSAELATTGEAVQSESQEISTPPADATPFLQEENQSFQDAAPFEVIDGVEPSEPVATAFIEEAFIPAEQVEEDIVSPIVEENAFVAAEVVPLTETTDESVRPFTAFIEEFRQAEAKAEARLSATLQGTQAETIAEFASTETSSETSAEPVAVEEVLRDSMLADTPTIDIPAESVSIEEVLPPLDFGEGSAFVPTGDGAATVNAVDETVQSALAAASSEENQRASAVAETSEGLEAPAITQRPERPVSPLLRPASRLRLPRHGGNRHREDAAASPNTSTEATTETDATQASLSTPSVEPVVETPKPARRYRFDRPSTQPTQPAQPASAAPVASNSAASTTQPTQARAPFARVEDKQIAPETKAVASTSTPTAGTPTIEQQTGEPPTMESTVISSPMEQGRRRHMQDRQRDKEQPAAPVTAPPSVADVAALIENGKTASTSPAEEVAPEDLPPLEYAELQKANSRRRRRHRTGNGSSTTSGVTPSTAQPTTSPESSPAASTATPTTDAPARQVESTPTSTTNPYTIVSGYTVNQMNQGNEMSGPFMGPEPSPARGSVNTTRDGRTVRAESIPQRSTSYPIRTSEGVPSAASMNQLANIVSQAIQTQTDRMVAELRRANQAPTNVSVSLPPFPSTERVGVFVDVANLLYSARTLRIAVDFGKLLDFLRGNRRLIRAHAYCPTSPQAGDEQMFLQSVKGLGYRITTKNYKTFSSGAKKADLDLDLCMDVVRIVDGGAVDCIVLVSGDSDFMPMLDYCSDHGVRVEVAAFDEAMSATLRQSCDLFVNLSMLEEIRA